MKIATFTLRADARQSIAWKRAAEAEGFASVGAWAAPALDAYLKARTRAGRPIPLYWRRGHFKVLLDDGRQVDTSGAVSPPFALFQGSSAGLNRNKPRTLVCLRTGRVIATLRSAKQCRELAAELAPVWVRDDQAAAGLVERHRREAV
jgi:hypothetical protein